MSKLRTDVIENLDNTNTVNISDIEIKQESYVNLGEYSTVVVPINYNNTITVDGTEYRLRANTPAPYTLNGDWSVDSPKFVSVGTEVLRQELGDPDGGSLVGFGPGATVGDLAVQGANLLVWERQPLAAAITTAGQMLSAQPVSVWEYADQITVKGDDSNPATWDWTPALQAAVDSGNSHVTIPFGEYRVDGTLVVPMAVTVYNFGILKRKAAYSSSTEPVVNVRHTRAAFVGGEVATENSHAEGVVRLGHDSTAATYTTTKWRFTDCIVRGVQAAGNVGVSLVCAQSINAANPANYFGHVSNITVLGADVGVQCEEYANAHTFVNVLFWNCITAGYRFYGAYGNCVQGGFVHTGSAGITGVILADSRVGSPLHHSDSNFVIGLGVEPAASGAFGYRIAANCQRNFVQLSANVAGGNEILNKNNTVLNAFSTSYFQRNNVHSFGRLEVLDRLQSDRHTERYGSATGIAEGAVTTVAEITVPGRNNMIVKLDLCVNNASLDRELAASLVYSLKNIGGTLTATQLSGDTNGAGATVSWDTTASPAKLRFTTFNNGTSSTYNASWRVSIQGATAVPTVA